MRVEAVGADRGLKYEEQQQRQQLAPLSWGKTWPISAPLRQTESLILVYLENFI